MGFISRWASRPAPVNPAWFTGLQCGNPWFIAAEWRPTRECCASNPGPWAVSTLLQLFGYYHGYFGPAVNLVWCMRISVLTATNSSAVDDEWVPASRAGHSFHVSMYIINTPDACYYEVSEQTMKKDEDVRRNYYTITRFCHLILKIPQSQQ